MRVGRMRMKFLSIMSVNVFQQNNRVAQMSRSAPRVNFATSPNLISVVLTDKKGCVSQSQIMIAPKFMNRFAGVMGKPMAMLAVPYLKGSLI